MNLIQYRLTDKPRFFLMRDVPEPALENDYYLIKEQIDKAFKLCESKALEIVNTEVLPNVYQCVVDKAVVAYRYKETSTLVKHNDTFPIPDGIEFKEDWHDWNEGVKVIRLSKKEEPVKEEENANKLLAALSNKEESHKPLLGYEQLYWISKDGTIGSLERKSKNNIGEVIYKAKIMKPHVIRDGYLRIKLRDSYGAQKSYLVHRLVGVNFIPNPNNLPEINHKDGNKQNNDASNLEWCDRLHNMRHARFILNKGGIRKK